MCGVHVQHKLNNMGNITSCMKTGNGMHDFTRACLVHDERAEDNKTVTVVGPQSLRVEIPAKSCITCELIDGLVEIGETVVTIRLPDGLDANVAKQYVDFLTNLTVPPLPTDYKLLRRLQRMWRKIDDFFGGFVNYLPNDAWTTELYECSDRMGRTATLDVVRRHCVFTHEAADMYNYLIPAADYVAADHRIEDLDLDLCGILQNDGTPKASWDAAKRECAALAELGLPWFDGESGVVVAGGKLVAALYERKVAKQDTDIFVVARDVATAALVIDRAIAAITTRFCMRDTYVQDHANTTEVYVFETSGGSHTMLHKFQIIRTAFPSPSHIVHGFDVDVCGLLFDGTALYMTANAARAISNGYNLYDQNKLSKSAESRYAKYLMNYDIGILVIGASQLALEAARRTRRLYPDMPTRHTRRPRWPYHNAIGILRHIGRIEKHLEKGEQYQDTADYDEDRFRSVYSRHAWWDDKRTVVMKQTKNNAFTGAFNPVVANTLEHLEEL